MSTPGGWVPSPLRASIPFVLVYLNLSRKVFSLTEKACLHEHFFIDNSLLFFFIYS